MPRVLWWGRSDPQYSRNQIILKLLGALGWQVDYFHPVASYLGKAQAFIQRPGIPDLVWVPCFRHRDVPGAAYWARKWKRPLIFDPLISAYQKEVFEKGKWQPTHRAAAGLRLWETGLYAQADVVVADTQAHARFFADTLQVDPGKIIVIHVGADEQLFKPTTVDTGRSPLEVLFYGSFLALQGPEVIIAAARAMRNEKIKWTLLGEGDLKSHLQTEAEDLPNVGFEPWISYQLLPQRLARAQILLGIFGPTPKAAMVIPNKVFQSMAVGRPLITRRSDAYPTAVKESKTIGWVPPADSKALAACVHQWAAAPERLAERGHQTRVLYEQNFSTELIKSELQTALERVLSI